MGWGFWAQGVKVHGASPEDYSVSLELGEPRMHGSTLTEVLSPWVWDGNVHSRLPSLLLDLEN